MKSFKKRLKRLSLWLNPIKTILDILVVIVVVLALLTSHKATQAAKDANILTRESLSASYTPWLKIEGFTLTIESDTTVFMYTLKNYSQIGPAIKLKVHSIMPVILDEKYDFLYDALMPSEEGSFSLIIPTKPNKESIIAFDNGTLPIKLEVTCEDVFGTEYSFIHEIRRFGLVYKTTEYRSLNHDLEGN